MNHTKFHNQCAWIPKYMNRGYPRVYTNPKIKRFWRKDDLSHKMRGMRVPWWRFMNDVTLLGQKSKSPSWLILAFMEKREGDEQEWWKEGRRRRMRRGNEKWRVCVLERKKKRDGKGKVVDWYVDERKWERGGEIRGGWERKSGVTIKLQTSSNFKL